MKQENLFLLKRWKDEPEDDWHFSIKDVNSRETKFFSSTPALTRYLQAPPTEAVPSDER